MTNRNIASRTNASVKAGNVKPDIATLAKMQAKRVVILSGRNKATRTAAFGRIANAAIAEAQSRRDVVACINVALGKAPSALDVGAARDRYIIGSIAARLTGKSDGARILSAERIVYDLATPTAKSLPKGLIGRRNDVEQRMYQAAKERFSQLVAETDYGRACAAKGDGAKTQAERNKAKRQPAMSGSKVVKAAELPSDKPMTAADCVDHVHSQIAVLNAFGNKHAKVMPLPMAAFLTRINAECAKVCGEIAELNAAAQATPANVAKRMTAKRTKA
jgi:hypothetical protein